MKAHASIRFLEEVMFHQTIDQQVCEDGKLADWCPFKMYIIEHIDFDLST